MPFDLAATWPWSASTAEFAVVWLVLSGFATGVGILAAIIVGDAIDGPVSQTVSSLRASQTVVPDTMLLGRFPRRDELLVVASLQGIDHLEAALAVTAMTAGWLHPLHSNDLQILDDVEPVDPILATLKAALQNRAAGVTLRRRLRTAALRVSPSLLARAEAMGLVRSGVQRSGLTALALSGVVISVVVAVLRSSDLHPWVYPAIAAHVGTTLLLVIPLTRRHRQARAYVRWLDDVMDAVRADVRAGISVSASDVILVAAVDGFDGLGRWGTTHGVDALRA